MPNDSALDASVSAESRPVPADQVEARRLKLEGAVGYHTRDCERLKGALERAKANTDPQKDSAETVAAQLDAAEDALAAARTELEGL